MGITGGGTTVAWTGTAGQAVIIASRITRIGGISKTADSVPDDDLADETAKQLAGDLITYSPIEIDVAYDKSEFNALPIYEVGDLTVTLPDGSTWVTEDAFVLSKGIGEIANNTRIIATYIFQPTGAWAITISP